MILKLENTTTHQIYEYEVKDMNNGEKLYFRFDIDTSDLVDGEYILSLYDGEKLVANDLLKIGDYNPSTLQYKKGENTYINVTLDNSVQGSKTVVIETIDTTITPDDGFNSISKVDVNAQPLYDNAYHIGHTEGYAEGEAKGVENAGEIIAETARVLEVTENGYYISRYSEPVMPEIVTGVYPDGTEFYDYAELNSKVFNTNITATPTTRLELWYKGDNTRVGDAFNIIIGAEKYTNNCYQIRYDTYSNTKIRVELGYKTLYHTWDENAWHHILIAKETEDASSMSLWVDEVKVGDFTNLSFNPQSTFYINGIETDLGGARRANGCFGMVKIDDTIIIPTLDGFINTNTGELLEVAEEGSYTFTNNTPQVPEGNLIKTIKVNVQPKIDVAKVGLKFGYSSFETIPEWADFSNVTNMYHMFDNCSSLKSIPEWVDFSNVTNMESMFNNCSSLKSIPEWVDFSNVTNMSYMFSNCTSLISISELDTSNVIVMDGMFNNCPSLTSIPALQAGKLNMTATYIGIFGFNDLPNITDFGGLIGLKYRLIGNYNLYRLPNLTYESCINVLNGLFDFTGNGETPESSMGQLKVHPNFLTTVGDEISIGTNKGWIITA